MASKNILSCNVSYTALPMKTELHFKPRLSLLQNCQQTSFHFFFVLKKLFETVLHLHYFSQDVPHVQKTFSAYKPMHMSSMGHNRGQVIDSLSDKCTALIQNNCIESESRNVDCQWTLVSFLVKHNHRVYPPPRGSEVMWGEVAHFLHWNSRTKCQR